MGNGMNKILPGLYIGNFKDARDAEQLSKNKVTHILSVHDSARPTLEGVKYLKYLNLPIIEPVLLAVNFTHSHRVNHHQFHEFW
uniref:Dual specificity protein phosphatase 22 n=1 Tax=Balaenoptera musculus TaxID=9771 RepID=A0A8C0C7I9_BALMU